MYKDNQHIIEKEKEMQKWISLIENAITNSIEEDTNELS